jgi:tRNA A37 threonylcarbamoyladenosine dehydratase
MVERFSRTEMLFGKAAMARLSAARVAVFGIGGVGGYAAEALARSGIGRMDLFDDDKICRTNINRQLHATEKSVGRYKVEAAAERILDINPSAAVQAVKLFYTPRTSGQVDLSLYDYVVDAVDTVSGKVELAVKSGECGVRVVSSMGAGDKFDATAFKVADIYDTSVCPLAKVMRRELRKRGVAKLKVVYSEEPPVQHAKDAVAVCGENCACPPGTERDCAARRRIPGSNAFVPPVVGLIIAGEVVKDIAMARG